MTNEENESSAIVNQKPVPSTVIDDIWSTFPNVHLRVLTAENGSVEIQICDCGMSGQCRPQGWARIEKHNRQRLADAIATTPADAEQLVRLREAAVLFAVPYEALLMDAESRKWIAPTVWKAIEDAVAALRHALGTQEGSGVD